jgi:hypothetical protein
MGGILYISKNFGVGLRECVAGGKRPPTPFLECL